MEDIRTVVAWLGVLGIPSIFAMTSFCIKACLKFNKDLRILQSAQKAQMRSQLLHQYYDYKEMVNNGERIANTDIDDWINQYNSYHELVGNNGVLDARKADLLTFPTYVRN